MSEQSDEAGSTRAGWSLLGQSLKASRRGVIAGVVLGLVWTAAKVSVPTLTRLGIDEGIREDRPGALLRYALLILGAGVIAGLFSGARRYNAFKVSRWVETDLRARLFDHLARLHFAFHDTASTGQLMSRANTDLQQIQFFLVMIPITLSNAAIVVAVAVILFLTHAGLAALALVALPLVNVLAKRFATRLHPAVMGLQQELAELAGVVEETVSGIRVVKGHGAEHIQADRLRAEADGVYDRSLETARIRATFLPALDLLPTIGLVVVLGYGGHLVLRGDLELGELVAFNAYLLMLVWPLRSTGLIVALAQRAAAAATRVSEVLGTVPVIADGPDAVGLPPGAGHVRFEDVSFDYGGNVVLGHLDLELEAGTSVALVGPTASGKSTVARLLPRFYDVTGGSLSIDGVDVRRLRVHELRRAVGTVFEDTFLFSDSIRFNIAFADPDASAEAVERAARLSGAHDFIKDLPDGYETLVGERGFSLSGGQRQRIAIARAIVADPRVLVLDDATSAVDPTKEHEIRDALAEVMRGRTTLVIAHRPATIALADRVVLLDHVVEDHPASDRAAGARIVASGTHAELLATSERYREVLASVDPALLGDDVDDQTSEGVPAR